MDLEKKVEPNVVQAVPFFAVANIEESVRYYADLDFVMTRKWIDQGKLRWCWLQIGSAALMLQQFRREGHDSRVPSGKAGDGTCRKLDAMARDLRQTPGEVPQGVG